MGTSPEIVCNSNVNLADGVAVAGNASEGSFPNAWLGGAAWGGNIMRNMVIKILQKILSSIYAMTAKIAQLMARRV